MQHLEEYFTFLSSGAEITALVGLVSYALAIACGFLSGIARAEKMRFLERIALVYVEFFRGTSLIVQLFWLYYCLPLIGIRIPPLLAGCLAIGLNSGAYASEIVRGAVMSVAKGQREAAIALNLRKRQSLWTVVVPQAIPEMLPAFGNLSVSILKDTSLVSLISIPEIAFKAQQLRTFTYDSARIYSVTLVMYFGMALVLLALGRALESRFGTKRRMRRSVLMGTTS